MKKKRIRVKLKEILKEKGISQAELSRMTGLRVATISAMCNSTYETVRMINVISIMNALSINSFDHILEIVELDDIDEKCDS